MNVIALVTSRTPAAVCVYLSAVVCTATVWCMAEEPGAWHHALVVDTTDVDGKVHVVDSLADDPVVRELFPGSELVWITVNERGQALCARRSGTTTEVLFLETTDPSVDPVTITGLDLPTDVEGALSPDGRTLCVRRKRGEVNTIEVIDLASGEVERVFEAEGPLSPPSWSSDGMAIAYYFGPPEALINDGFEVGVSVRDDDKWKHTAVADPSKLCHRSPSRTRAPGWAYGGRAIIFEARYKDDEIGPQAYLVNIDGTGLTWLAAGGVQATDYAGKHIVCARPEEGIFLRHADTGEERQISLQKGAYAPRVSADGTFVAYSDSDGKIFVMESDGSRLRLAMSTGRGVPTWRFSWVRTGEGAKEP